MVPVTDMNLMSSDDSHRGACEEVLIGNQLLHSVTTAGDSMMEPDIPHVLNGDRQHSEVYSTDEQVTTGFEESMMIVDADGNGRLAEDHQFVSLSLNVVNLKSQSQK